MQLLAYKIVLGEKLGELWVGVSFTLVYMCILKIFNKIVGILADISNVKSDFMLV